MKKFITLIVLLLLSVNNINSGQIRREFKFEDYDRRIYRYFADTTYSSNCSMVYANVYEKEYKAIEKLDIFKLGGDGSIRIELGYFKEKIGYLESRGNYSAKNRFGHLGKYQFSEKTLRGLGYNSVQIKYFLKSPELQEEAMDSLSVQNFNILKKYGLLSYVGKNIGGTRVTVYGMMAGAHLLGPYAVKHFIETGGSMKSVKIGKIIVSKHDANGTSIIDYMNEFI